MTTTMRLLKFYVLALALALTCAAEAAVYRTGLKQYYFENDSSTWDMNHWETSIPNMDLTSYSGEVDYSLGLFVGEFSYHMIDDTENGGGVNPVSGKWWGWPEENGSREVDRKMPNRIGYIYDGEIWLEKDVTYNFVRANFANGLLCYIDGNRIGTDWSRSEGTYTPETGGWHALRVACYMNDWQAGHGLDDFAAVYWNTNGLKLADAVAPWADEWHYLFDDGTDRATPLRCVVDKSFVEATVAPAEGGYNVTIVGSVDLDNVVARLAATAADPENPSAWAVSSEPVSVTAGTPTVVFLPWIDDSIPYFTVYAEGEDAEFNEGYRAFSEYTAVEPCVAPGLCTWTGLGDGSSWTDKANWDVKRPPMVGDDILFTGDASVVISRAEQVVSLTVTNGATVTVSASDDAGWLSTEAITVDGTLSFEAGCKFLGGADGTCDLAVLGESSITFTGDINAEAGSTQIVKTGPGFVGFSHESTLLNTLKPTISVVEGCVVADKTKALGGTLNIGGGEHPAIVSNVDAVATGSMNINILTNGVFDMVSGDYAWDKMPKFSIERGGYCRYQKFTRIGYVNFKGGELCGVPEVENSGRAFADGAQTLECSASSFMSRMSIWYRMAGNEYPVKFKVARGTAPVDLLVTGDIARGSDKQTDTDYKEGDGIVVSKGSNTMPEAGYHPSKEDFDPRGFEIRAGTWVADGTPAFGDCEAHVMAGATLGGTGVVGGTIATAGIKATGAEGNLATVRPGSIDVDEAAETFGDHVYGTLTVGSDDVANDATFGEYSALEIGFGGEKLHDALDVKGAATIDATGTVLRLVNETPEGGALRGGTYTVLSAAGGITGTFAEVESIGFKHIPEVAYTANGVEVSVFGSGFYVILR